MDKRIQTRYLILVYLLLLSLAGGLTYWASTAEAGKIKQSFLLNLATELIGVVVVFFVLKVFLVDDNNYSEQISQIIERFGSRPTSAKEFFREWPDMRTHLMEASRIDVSGILLGTTIHRNYGVLLSRLRAGVDIRIMIIDPESEAAQMWATRIGEQNRGNTRRDKVKPVMQELRTLVNEYVDYRNSSNTSGVGNFSICLLPYAPSYGIFSFNHKRTNPQIFVEIYVHKHVSHQQPPTFELKPDKDGNWYDYFVQEFDLMWRTGRVMGAEEFIKFIDAAHL
jgi:hypothetical protein